LFSYLGIEGLLSDKLSRLGTRTSSDSRNIANTPDARPKEQQHSDAEKLGLKQQLNLSNALGMAEGRLRLILKVAN